MRQIRAIQALRWNYRWQGVCVVLGARVNVPGTDLKPQRGWWLVLRYPSTVRHWQHAVAEGVIW